MWLEQKSALYLAVDLDTGIDRDLLSLSTEFLSTASSGLPPLNGAMKRFGPAFMTALPFVLYTRLWRALPCQDELNWGLGPVSDRRQVPINMVAPYEPQSFRHICPYQNRCIRLEDRGCVTCCTTSGVSSIARISMDSVTAHTSRLSQIAATELLQRNREPWAVSTLYSGQASLSAQTWVSSQSVTISCSRLFSRKFEFTERSEAKRANERGGGANPSRRPQLSEVVAEDEDATASPFFLFETDFIPNAAWIQKENFSLHLKNMFEVVDTICRILLLHC
ncbi:uncharacterized protein MYCFIDRAFT_207378 [Pseudocercospora fijiensis CIRAD86]|uniref:Uncharacterized protein n=1 Tax=Pseudocercospora fijiensis (strain CIRAD86) TaxID=383855 RepID=M3AJK9_PSEFD|nr:uncharacterized protein MYCFIDRAFT_207378 [Pseudocercospora fijiensis CIRAD86]EME84741.1 hypothetical protein MYCFIDRAFT_207378 [Pseudocercospora fijiensis CIRAD86]